MGAASSWIPGSLESFSSGPEDVPKALRPLLDLRLDELCELYQKFAGQEQLQPQSVARELRLDQRNAELLVKKLDSFDLLVLLVVVSHTHFLTKARGGLKMQCHANKIKQDETRVKNSMSLKMCLGPRWFTKLCSFCGARLITKGSLGYLSSMYFSTSLVLGEVDVPFPEIETRESRTET
ncbi:unnamed protein product [Cladocopium goreaui]|uniref:Uncharacterized protein n=1 Tax=Cladocopium goreaui TaxID=2562237 RepID=A0A9P1BTN4_9DINO|nr:unnamed protein product [Cladocopium goreaui]